MPGPVAFRKIKMTEIERLTLALAMLTARVDQLIDEVDRLRSLTIDARDIFRNCACFGADDMTGVV